MSEVVEVPVRERSSLLATVTREIVKLRVEHLGRGPGVARSEWVGADGVLCMMRETFTPAELTLIRGGHGAQVREVRQSLRDAMEPRLRGVVEGILDRRVLALLSQVDVANDVAIDFFLLEPRPA